MGLFFNTLFASCLICMFIAIGFIPFMVSLFSFNESKDTKAAGLSGIAFAIICVVLILLVYYAECTTIRLNQNLSQETLSIISYSYIGGPFSKTICNGRDVLSRIPKVALRSFGHSYLKNNAYMNYYKQLDK